MKTKEQVINFLNELDKKEEAHWEKLNEFGYVDFPETETETCWHYECQGVTIYSTHEDSSYGGIKDFAKWLLEENK
jgi:hypothetical protein